MVRSGEINELINLVSTDISIAEPMNLNKLGVKHFNVSKAGCESNSQDILSI